MSEIELEIGEVLLVGDLTLTIVDIDHDDVTFKIDQSDSDEQTLVTLSRDISSFQRGLNSTPVVDSLPR